MLLELKQLHKYCELWRQSIYFVKYKTHLISLAVKIEISTTKFDMDP